MNFEFRKMNADEFDSVFSILVDSFPADEYRDYENSANCLITTDIQFMYSLTAKKSKDLLPSGNLMI